MLVVLSESLAGGDDTPCVLSHAGPVVTIPVALRAGHSSAFPPAAGLWWLYLGEEFVSHGSCQMTYPELDSSFSFPNPHSSQAKNS